MRQAGVFYQGRLADIGNFEYTEPSIVVKMMNWGTWWWWRMN